MHMVLGPFVGPVVGRGLVTAYPWPGSGSWLRLAMVTTLDGAVTGSDGRSRSISSASDREILGEVRRLSDAIVVGASTVRAEPYGPVLARADSAAERAALGLAEAPRLVIVSRTLDLPWQQPMFAESTVRPLIVTDGSASGSALRAARAHADVDVLPGGRVAPRELVAHLASLGLRRLVCEGGPALAAALAADGVIDEVDLAVSPLLAGGGPRAGSGPSIRPEEFTLRHLIVDDSFVFHRYVARRSDELPEPSGVPA